jgi:hypothetical protein
MLRTKVVVSAAAAAVAAARRDRDRDPGFNTVVLLEMSG